MKEAIIKLCQSQLAADVGFFNCDDVSDVLRYGITIVYALSDSIVDEITDAPTYTYFHHYRAVNAHLDRTALMVGTLLQQNGWRYITIAASQSTGRFKGRFSHKKGACLAGIGGMGVNNLFIHRNFGSRVRLATVFTDFPAAECNPGAWDICTACMACVRACPALAISKDGFDAAACSEYMKRRFQHIGRGAVCGICMRVCPMTGHNIKNTRTPGQKGDEAK